MAPRHGTSAPSAPTPASPAPYSESAQYRKSPPRPAASPAATRSFSSSLFLNPPDPPLRRPSGLNSLDHPEALKMYPPKRNASLIDLVHHRRLLARRYHPPHHARTCSSSLAACAHRP